jgi:MarR family multiple antibiotic resistance transcriptional regulator
MTQANPNEDQAYRKYVPFLDRDYNLFSLMSQTHSAIFRARYIEVMNLGVTSMEAALLTIVHGLGGSATPSEIARWMMRKRPTISELLSRMERNGLVKRTDYKGNKRQKRVLMTAKGREALERASQHDVMHTIMGSISHQEFRQLWLLLEKLNESAMAATDELEQTG